MSLHDDINLYLERGLYPFHMPGHKRNLMFDCMNGLLAYDLTEVDGTDDLHCPQGMLLDAQKRAAALYGSEQAYFLVNGSTSGILTSVSASVPSGGKIIVARNCHKSVYNAVFLRNLTPVYVYPSLDADFGIGGSILPEDIEKTIAENPDAKAVVLTSPTYDGVVSDIKTIARIVHKNNMILLVDAAHGAHHGMHPSFPESAIRLGADAVVTSLHKTLPSPTGTAMLLINSDRIEKSAVRRYLDIYETSSPSYLFLSAMDACIGLLSERKDELFSEFSDRLDRFAEEVKDFKNLQFFCMGADEIKNHPTVFAHDKSRIVVKTGELPINGFDLARILREQFSIESEMAFGDCTVLLTSICDTQEGFDRLTDALREVDAPDLAPFPKQKILPVPKPEIVFIPAEAEQKTGQLISLEEAANHVCREYVCAYPPGTPILVPGERITDEILSYMGNALAAGANITGSSGEMPDRIDICTP